MGSNTSNTDDTIKQKQNKPHSSTLSSAFKTLKLKFSSSDLNLPSIPSLDRSSSPSTTSSSSTSKIDRLSNPSPSTLGPPQLQQQILPTTAQSNTPPPKHPNTTQLIRLSVPIFIEDWIVHNNVLVLDTRSPEDYGLVHLQASLNVFAPPILAKRWRSKSSSSSTTTKSINIESIVQPDTARVTYTDKLASAHRVCVIDYNDTDLGQLGSVAFAIGYTLLNQCPHLQVASLIGGWVQLVDSCPRTYLTGPLVSALPVLRTAGGGGEEVDVVSPPTQPFQRTTSFTLQTSNLRRHKSNADQQDHILGSVHRHSLSTTQSRLLPDSSSLMQEKLTEDEHEGTGGDDDALTPLCLDPSQILDTLWLGPDLFGQNPVSAPLILTKMGVSAVLNMAKECLRPLELPACVTVYKQICAQDFAEEKIELVLNEAVTFIDLAHQQNMKVYVHCKAGKSRSATVVMAYLMMCRQYSFDSAWSYVRSKRPVVAPNIGFITVLRDLDSRRRVFVPDDSFIDIMGRTFGYFITIPTKFTIIKLVMHCSQKMTNNINNNTKLLEMHIRMPNGNRIPLTLTESTTIADLHTIVHVATKIPPENQFLVYKGKRISALNDDSIHQSCSDFMFKSNDTIYLSVRNHNNNPPTSSNQPPVTVNLPTAFPKRGTSPILEAMLSNTDMIHSLVMMDPRMKSLAKSNPDMAKLLQDPDFLRQMVQTSRNPAALREMQRNQDRALANLETIPGGYMALKRLYTQTAGAMDTVMTSPQASSQDLDFKSKALQQQLNVHPILPRSLNTCALPNPWQPLLPTPVLSNTNAYEVQLGHMVDMGFNRDLSARALRQAQGDLDHAVELVVVASGDSSSPGGGGNRQANPASSNNTNSSETTQ